MEIKTCPFCGKKATISMHMRFKTEWYEVSCANPSCKVVVYFEGFGKDKVIEKWNTRKG